MSIATRKSRAAFDRASRFLRLAIEAAVVRVKNDPSPGAVIYLATIARLIQQVYDDFMVAEYDGNFEAWLENFRPRFNEISAYINKGFSKDPVVPYHGNTDEDNDVVELQYENVLTDVYFNEGAMEVALDNWEELSVHLVDASNHLNLAHLMSLGCWEKVHKAIGKMSEVSRSLIPLEVLNHLTASHPANHIVSDEDRLHAAWARNAEANQS